MTTQNILLGVTLTATLSGVASAQQSLSTTTVTVRGCLQSDPNNNGVGTTERFLLRYATIGIGQTSGDSIEGADPRAGATSTSYVLDGSATEFRQNVNRQVEITGRFETRTDSSSERPDILDGLGESSTSSSRSGPRLHVDSMRTVASTCSR